MKEKLKEVLAIQSYSYRDELMVAYLLKELDRIGCNYYIDDGSIYVTKGDSFSYPCVVSHMDTVHKITDDLTVVEINGKLTGINAVTMEQTGIGGDDKVGVFITLQCLENFDYIKAVFFRDEEIGCDGSYNCEASFFYDCDFVLQCDRKGNDDFVTKACGVQLSSKKFQKDVKQLLRFYGYKFTNGMMTDVMALKEMGIKCSMANISCGYYHPHCDYEYVDIDDVINCLELVKDIITLMAGNDYPCKYIKPAYKKQEIYTDYKKANFADVPTESDVKGDIDKWYNEYYNKKDNKKEYCEGCEEKAELKYVFEYSIHLCDKCIDDYVNYYKNPDIPKTIESNGKKFYLDTDTNIWKIASDNKIIDDKTLPF